MRRTIISAAVGVGLACGVFWSAEFVENVQRAAHVAELQSQDASEWLLISPMRRVDGVNRGGVVTEPMAVWSAAPQRMLEVRVAITTRDMSTGEPVCVGGTNTVIAEPTKLMEYRRELSRLAGVNSCDWPVGQYRSRLTWTMTEPETRVAKTIFQETAPFRVLP